jgi:hypothetical protein
MILDFINYQMQVKIRPVSEYAEQAHTLLLPAVLKQEALQNTQNMLRRMMLQKK